MRVVTLTELTSGVDALYLSGRASVPFELLERLDLARKTASEGVVGPPFQFGDFEFTVSGHGWGSYRYLLEHPYGRIGITPSARYPSIRFQPYAPFLHGVGSRGVVEWIEGLITETCGHVRFSVARIDLFADFQGWSLEGDSRHEFMCRAKHRRIFEEDGVFTGVDFGSRKTGTKFARIYVKSIQMREVGAGYLPMIWGEKYNVNEPVIRVEFEVKGDWLREFGLRTPDEVLDAAGALWLHLTSDWLTHRVPGMDQTKARWPTSPEWECVQRASITEGAHGINRMFLGLSRGGIANLLPGLTGFLSSFAAYANAKTFREMLPDLDTFMGIYEKDSGQSFEARVEDKRRKFGLP
jgi:hypothetical protein